MSKYSQFDEEAALEKIFSEIGTTNKKAFEFGCHIGYKFSNIRLLEEQGWTCQYFGIEDKKPEHGDYPELTKEYFNAENVNEIFDRHAVPDEPDFLSIDVDGMDYYIWKAMDRVKPRVVCIEYNIRRPEGIQPYKADNVWNSMNDSFFGACKEEMLKLGTEKGYKCVHENEANLFFVKL